MVSVSATLIDAVQVSNDTFLVMGEEALLGEAPSGRRTLEDPFFGE